MKADAFLPQHIAIALIGGYQKHISPRKGFSCAHRLLYGGESCSQHIKRLIAQKGVIRRKSSITRAISGLSRGESDFAV